MKAKIEFEGDEVEFIDTAKIKWVKEVSCKEVITYGSGKHKIVLVDCGVKDNIIRCLLKRDTTVIRVPWDFDFTNMEFDALFISNGPGDPQMCTSTVEHIRATMQTGKPIFGICMGNQLLSIAAGAKTYKLKYGHRGHNQPVILNGTNKCFRTS